MNSIPPPNNIGWCIHTFINSSSLEDHISCKQHRLDEGAIVLSESINGVAASISFSSLLQPDYDKKSIQDAIWYFLSVNLIEWCNDVHALVVSDMRKRSCARC
ncbi:hypothetical protein Nepgr_005622 [Nepenthes gracilis]|uniref:Uncharacterized protein n=1 Tax=Nepenthes gracilis TaxID=150966 RepID=A0AAD3S3M6_NEPGR|nr:hypothetical protein Nepgr_005622 [Nepenthes gracilis]